MADQFYNAHFTHEKLTTDAGAKNINTDCQAIRIANTSTTNYVDIYFEANGRGTPYRLSAGEVLPPFVVFPFVKIKQTFSAVFEGGAGEISIIREFNEPG